MRLGVAFLWHMHQPMYKDILDGTVPMPWVRLHGIKAYYDMAAVLKEYPDIRVTINLVPSLLVQIRDYAEGNVKDKYLELSRKPVKNYTKEEKRFVLWNFFMANWDRMIKPYPRYWELLTKRGFQISEEEVQHAVDEFTVQEIRDLVVWFNLSWFGFMARKNFPEINRYIAKGEGFSEEDKNHILDIQIRVLKEILPLYKELKENRQVELTVSPFYHPVMPLIYDTEIANRSMPQVELPNRFSYPEDVDVQIRNAVDLYRECFGDRPAGMWPPEGGVCSEIVPILHKNGIRWIATDEQILMMSTDVEDKGLALYKPYRVKVKNKPVTVVFRDKGLSNAISFVYTKKGSQEAVDDMMLNLNNIKDYLESNNIETGLVTIALDGENPWEYYEEGGEGFLRGLYGRLSEDKQIYTTTVADYIDENPPEEVLSDLYSGSWIAHNFDIWIGDPEENTAWNYLNMTRGFLKELETNLRDKISPDKFRLAWESLYAAEGSDWFWWYGDDFHTDLNEEFDQIFRNHLSNVYRAFGYKIPEYLKQPIIYVKEVMVEREPIRFIRPVIDGMNTHYYEWQDAGCYRDVRAGGKLHKGRSFFSVVYFGFNMENLYLRIDPLGGIGELKGRRLMVYINIIQPRIYEIAFPLSPDPEEISGFWVRRSEDGINFEQVGEFNSIRFKKIFELSVPFSIFDFRENERVLFYVQIRKDGMEIERHPKKGFISFSVPSEDFEIENWSV